VSLDPLGREDCTCQQFVDAEGSDRHWLLEPRYTLCACGHSAAWHDENTGRCWFPTPEAKRIWAAMVVAGETPEDKPPAYWELVAAGETPTGKPSMADITAWNEQRRIMWLAADIAGMYGDTMLAQACSNMAGKIIEVAERATREGT
jgi:hypothetical protein